MSAAYAILAVLITQSYGGKMSVVENLSDHACAEAVCTALNHGRSCAENEAFWAAKMAEGQKEEAAWLKAHPQKPCPPKQFCSVFGHRTNGEMFHVGEGDIETARCVK